MKLIHLLIRFIRWLIDDHNDDTCVVIKPKRKHQPRKVSITRNNQGLNNAVRHLTINGKEVY